MTESTSGKRGALVRESLVFQVKLIADGMRDFILVPISLAATAIGLLRSGEDPETEFQRVIDLGIKSERWINLFGQHDPLEEAGSAGSIDLLLTRAEEVVRQQAKDGGVSEGASEAIQRSLEKAHKSVRDAMKKDNK